MTKKREVDGDKLWKWVLRIGGLAGIAWETLIANNFHPELLPLFAGMIGLDKVLEWDSKRRGKNGSNGKTEVPHAPPQSSEK